MENIIENLISQGPTGTDKYIRYPVNQIWGINRKD